MILKKLTLINFKNIAHEEIFFGDGINCFVGDNGAGKTNIIDALYYLSMCKSSLQSSDSQNIMHDAEFFMLDGSFLTADGKSESVVCSYSRKGGKVFKRNAKEYERLADHVGLIPTVIVSPSDSTLISDSADERRRYLNGFISQLDRSYLSSVMRYNAILSERNKFLKMSIDEQMLLIYDSQLSQYAKVIYELRKHYIELLQPLVAQYYRILSEDKEQIEIQYRSELNEAKMEDILLKNRERDFVNQFTTQGVHRDDMLLKIGGYPLRKYGSQGQQKSFLLALKLAQYSLVARECNKRPILLLDDLFDKLDAGRVTQLLKLVSSDDFGQILITDCNPTRLKTVLDRASVSYNLFTVEGGAIKR